jgi:hypothetical protein
MMPRWLAVCEGYPIILVMSAGQLVDGLDLRADAVDHSRKQIPYASAWFDWKLTQLEGAEC